MLLLSIPLGGAKQSLSAYRQTAAACSLVFYFFDARGRNITVCPETAVIGVALQEAQKDLLNNRRGIDFVLFYDPLILLIVVVCGTI